MAMPDLDLDTRRPMEALPAWVGVVEKAKRGWQQQTINSFSIGYTTFHIVITSQGSERSNRGVGD